MNKEKYMFEDTYAFSGFSVKNEVEAKEFYEIVLGIEVESTDMGLNLKIADRDPVFVYQKDDHQPATYTILNFVVDDIDAVVDALTEKGIEFELYDMPGIQDEKGIMRGKAAKRGPDIAWFKDPSGNVLSILCN